MFVETVTLIEDEGGFRTSALVNEFDEVEGIGSTKSEALRDLAEQLEAIGQ